MHIFSVPVIYHIICVIFYVLNRYKIIQICLYAMYLCWVPTKKGRYKKDKPNLYPTHTLSQKEARKYVAILVFFTALFHRASSHWSQTYEAYFVTLLVRNDDSFLIKTSVLLSLCLLEYVLQRSYSNPLHNMIFEVFWSRCML